MRISSAAVSAASSPLRAIAGVFVLPILVNDQIAAQFEAERIVDSLAVIDQICAISAGSRLTHGAAVAISQAARNVTHA